MPKIQKSNLQPYTLIKGQLNDWAMLDKRSVAAQMRGTGDSRPIKWERYETRLLELGFLPEDIPAKYHQKVLAHSRTFDLMAIFGVVLSIISSVHTHQGVPEITSATAFFGMLGAFYLTRKYIKKTDGGIFGYRNWINLLARR
jgi:hypothetical protein